MKEYSQAKMETGHYQADATILRCIDERTKSALKSFVEKEGLTRYDDVSIPGSIKALASPASEEEKKIVLGYIASSVRLHHSKKIVLVAHNECGGYGGVVGKEYYLAELEKAAAVVANALPEILIEKVLIDFDGTTMLP